MKGLKRLSDLGTVNDHSILIPGEGRLGGGLSG